MSRSARWVVLLIGITACYRPRVEGDCQVHCDRLAEIPTCPGALACGSDGLCFAGSQECGMRPDRPDAAPPADAFVNDAGKICYGGPRLFQYCIDPGSEPVTASPQGAFDTSTCQLVDQVGGPQLCVIIAKDIKLDVPLTPTGNAPLVLIATHDLIVNAPIDVSDGGAGARTGACNQQAAAVGAADSGGYGAGGSGGSVSSASNTVPTGGAGGAGGGGNTGTTRQNPIPVTRVHGGCAGGAGGGDASGVGQGAPGKAGGVIYLIAGGTLAVNAHLLANGGGGGPGESLTAGGGGGGSGGLIVLDAPTITISGAVVLQASGGGGGGGGSDNATDPPTAGGVASPSLPSMAARGGTGAVLTSGGGSGSSRTMLDGGDGGSGEAVNGSGGLASGGGGGGGGSAGVIWLFGDPMPTSGTGAVAVPPPST